MEPQNELHSYAVTLEDGTVTRVENAWTAYVTQDGQLNVISQDGDLMFCGAPGSWRRISRYVTDNG